VLQFQGRHPFRAIDHHWRDNLFATAGAAVEVWSHERSEPVNTFSWGADAVLSVRFNPVSLVELGNLLFGSVLVVVVEWWWKPWKVVILCNTITRC
jgi:hypothetical protein